MPSFTLNVEFNSSDLSTILAAKERVVILKTPVIAEQSVVWVAFSPFEANEVSWEDDYAVYASQSETLNGAVIKRMAEQQAEPQMWYPFKEGAFGPPVKAANIGPGEYGIRNQQFDVPALTFGMAQAAQVNGEVVHYQPLNAQTVLRGQEAVFTPEDSIAVALMARVESGFVISEVSGTPIVLKFGGGVVSATIKYDGETGRFVAA